MHTLSLERYMEFHKKYILSKMKLFSKIIFILLIFSGIASIVIKFMENESDSIVDKLIPGVFFIIFPFLLIYFTLKNAKSTYNTKQSIFVNVEYTFYENIMILRLSNENEYKVHFNTLHSIDENEHAYFLFSDSISAYIIDKSIVPDIHKEQLAEILKKAKAKLTISEHLV